MMNKKNILKFLPWVLVLIFSFVIFYLIINQQNNTSSNNEEQGNRKVQNVQTSTREIKSNSNENITNNSNIPNYVIEVYNYIKQNNKAPEGYVGGRFFQNREKQLPMNDTEQNKIKYQEWDVHIKESGKNRGAERLVTGSDISAYYTNNHYKSFKKIN